MTSEELKKIHSMRSIIESYGLKINRAGFASCPFHKGDRDASLKIYDDSYYCFGCGASGDIFSFIQRMDNVTFKEAFYSLGGTYEKPTFESKVATYRLKQKKKMAAKKKQELRKRVRDNIRLIDLYRDCILLAVPMSELWCECMNALQYQMYLYDELRKEVGC